MFGTHLTVIGTLITNINRRRLTDGTTVVNFRVASNERRFDRASGTWTDGDTLYVSVTCWRQLAENVHRTFNMGDPIIVQGRLYTRNYEDREGRAPVRHRARGVRGRSGPHPGVGRRHPAAPRRHPARIVAASVRRRGRPGPAR